MDNQSKRPLIPIIAGPTAVGKTATSIALAKELNAEIISADSRQVYKEFSIGTASPTNAEMAMVPHHFVKEISIGEPYSAGIFARNVSDVIDSIYARGKNIVISGGSTLYVHALLEGLSDIPEIDPDVRIKLNNRLQKEGSQTLFNELEHVDPVFSSTLDATKSQRIIRGLEVWYGTGQQLSTFHAKPLLKPDQFRLFVLYRDRKELYDRINLRVDQMIEEGFIDEVKTILQSNPDLNDNAFRTIGYQELLPVLADNASLDTEGSEALSKAVELIKRNSRRYAKRQLTWYKQYHEAVWIDVTKSDAEKIILEAIQND